MNPSSTRRLWAKGTEPSGSSSSDSSSDEDEQLSHHTNPTNTGLGYIFIHRVTCSLVVTRDENHSEHNESALYLDVPRMFTNNTRASALHGKQKVRSLSKYSDESSGYSVVVVKDYDCLNYHHQHADLFKLAAAGFEKPVLKKLRPWLYRLTDIGPPAIPSTESIVTHDTLSNAIALLVAENQPQLGHWNAQQHLKEPYDYFFYFRRLLREKGMVQLESATRAKLLVLLNYVDSAYGAAFDKVDETLMSGKVNQTMFPKLFGPGEIIVTSQNGILRALIADKAVVVNLRGQTLSVTLECTSWTFDGSFRKTPEIINVKWPKMQEFETDLSRLSAWPLRLDTSGIRESLLSRGLKLWECRRKKLVCYNEPTPTVFEMQITNPKYMIDYQTYRQMHPTKSMKPLLSNAEMKETGVDMDDDEPPSDLFCILLPATVLGYAFHDKKWRNLSVEYICPVPWNKEAFSRLVLKPRKKDTIKALVMVHLKSVQNVDVVGNKGNGLIILLHGSPGTGKTLTAESVAELAEKPLYRVTCADIGTDPGSVEKYLESVLLLGTIWECVVLLDEADVFLEERQVTDLTRNALVAVFLRVLEYYDGILILTTNRVGTFDEAFKSRIQLAVHYPALGQDDRLQIWLNFINILHEKNVFMDYAELKRKADFLARIPFNGRQIRNMLLTAAQVAKYKNERLDYNNLEQIVEICQEFEEYLLQTQGLTDAENAKAQGLRDS